jgi:hypothetical protein
MSNVWFEGNGEPRAATYDELRDLFIATVRNHRDQILSDPTLEHHEDSTMRDRVVADAVITGVFNILDGNHPDLPGFHVIPDVNEEAVMVAMEAGGNWIPYDDGSDNYEPLDISGNLAEYFSMINT